METVKGPYRSAEEEMRKLETELKDVLVEMTAIKGVEEALKRMDDKGI